MEINNSDSQIKLIGCANDLSLQNDISLNEMSQKIQDVLYELIEEKKVIGPIPSLTEYMGIRLTHSLESLNPKEIKLLGMMNNRPYTVHIIESDNMPQRLAKDLLVLPKNLQNTMNDKFHLIDRKPVTYLYLTSVRENKELTRMFRLMMKKVYPDIKITDSFFTLREYYRFIRTLPQKHEIQTQPRGVDKYKASLLQKSVRPNDVVLDYGCGSGFMINLLNNKSLCVERPEMKEVHESLRDKGVKFKSEFMYANDISDIQQELKDSKYTVASFFHVIHHIQNPENLLRNLIQYSPMLHTIVVYDHDVVNQDQTEALLLEHEVYTHAYNEKHYYTKFLSWDEMKSMFARLGFYEHYSEELRQTPDYSYIAVFKKRK